MVKREIVSYIEKQLAKGFHISMIKKALVDVGHEIKDIEEAVAHVDKKKSHSKTIALVVILLVIIAGAYYIFTMMGEDEVDDRADPESCDDIEDEALREECKQLIETNNQELSPEQQNFNDVMEDAVLNNDITQCAQLEDETLREECEYVVSRASGGSSSSSGGDSGGGSEGGGDSGGSSDEGDDEGSPPDGGDLDGGTDGGEEEDQYENDREIFFFAVGNNDIELCEEIVDDTLREECIYIISQQS